MPTPRVLLVAAIALVSLAPPAGAATNQEPSCPEPMVGYTYDASAFSLQVSLPASGCPAREHHQFTLSAAITRVDNNGQRQTLDRSAACGPYRAASDSSPDTSTGRYSCDLALTMDHPAPETSRYQLDIDYPGADHDETLHVETLCRTTTDDASCSDPT